MAPDVMAPDRREQSFLRRIGSDPVSGMVAFLFTDIVGSTRRWEEWPEAMRLALARHDAMMREAITAREGHVFRTLGDAFMAAFSSPAEAAAAAVDAQWRLARADFRSVGGISVRMAIYAGIVEAREGDYFGQAPNRTARLLSATHGGQILVAGTAAEMLAERPPEGVGLIDLGSHRLRDLPQAEHVVQLAAPGLAESFPPILSLERLGNLPLQTTSFIGREDDVHAIAARLGESRLVTILGAGGLGKTRLALEVATRSRAFADGAWFAELAPVADPQLVAEQVCAAVGAPLQGPSTPIERLVTHLRGRPALIVLDNCEHVIAAAAHLVHRVLRECVGPSFLVTSREALGVPGETIWRVEGLATPPEDVDLSPEEALRYGAAQLFLDRARAALGAHYAPDEEDARAIANICRRLDGIPLALELAAARVKLMGVRKLSERIHDRFRLLSGGARVLLARQQTLTALYDWSYNLLDPREQTLFRRMAVFGGGATLERICALGESCVDEVDALTLVASLVDKSLLIADDGDAEPRWRMVETTRAYAWTKLREAGEVAYASDFARRLAADCRAAHEDWPRAGTKGWIARVAPDIDNLRAALDWTLAQRGDVEAGLELLSWTARMWEELSLLEERRRWFALAAQEIGRHSDPGLAARIWFGALSLIAHGDRSNIEPARRAADAFRVAGDDEGLGESLHRVGAALLTPSTVAEAEAPLREACALLRRRLPGKPLAACLRSMGLARSFVGDMAGARPLIEESMALMRAIGDERGMASGDITLAEIRYAMGEVDGAVKALRDLIDSGRANRRQMTVALGNMTAYLLAQNRIVEARFALIEGLREARAVGHAASLARLVEHAALIAALAGDLSRAARLLGYGAAFYAKGEASREYTEDVTLARADALIAAGLAAEDRALEAAVGARWSPAQAAAAARGA